LITIYDIAEKVGVNPSTVSRALKNAPGISESLTNKIQKAAQDMGYSPNMMARHLRMKTSSIIGVILDEEWNWYSGAIADGVQSYAREKDIKLIFWNAKSVEDQKSGLDVFEEMRIAGVVFASTQIGENSGEFSKLSFPAVFVNRINSSRTSRILTDDLAGAYLVTEHLLSLGHRCIGFINGPKTSIHSINRLKGVKQALKQAGLELNEQLYHFCNDDWSVEETYKVAKQMLDGISRPTAIFTGNDEMAISVYQAAQELGLQIPRDLSVVGYNNHVCCQYMLPKLTTLSLPLWQMGRNAMEAIYLKINGKELSKDKRTVNGELIIRQSTGPCPQS
jgi:DNA-binding LacI/PurR family transcriptional regulator